VTLTGGILPAVRPLQPKLPPRWPDRRAGTPPFVWGVRFNATCLGGYCNSGASRIRVFVNGKPVPSDRPAIKLTQHVDIVVTYGTAPEFPEPIPSSYSASISRTCAPLLEGASAPSGPDRSVETPSCRLQVVRICDRAKGFEHRKGRTPAGTRRKGRKPPSGFAQVEATYGLRVD